MEGTKKNVLVVGASRGSGRATVEALLARGHAVTAFARHADELKGLDGKLRMIAGDALKPADVAQAVQGQDAVIVTLGISESAVRVRLFGKGAHTPLNVRSAGTRNVIAAMQRHGVRRLVVQTSYGVGATRDKLPFAYRLMFSLLLKPQIADTEQQEREVRASGLDWTLVQPVNLTDLRDDGEALASVEGAVGNMQVARKWVARFLADTVQGGKYIGRSVALSAP